MGAYDKNGTQLTAVYDKNGNPLTLAYDKSGNEIFRRIRRKKWILVL